MFCFGGSFFSSVLKGSREGPQSQALPLGLSCPVLTLRLPDMSLLQATFQEYPWMGREGAGQCGRLLQGAQNHLGLQQLPRRVPHLQAGGREDS